MLIIEDIAEDLRVNKETVRRWIRNGRLKAIELDCKRDGYKIRLEDYKEFLSSNPKYYNASGILLYNEKVDKIEDDISDLVNRYIQFRKEQLKKEMEFLRALKGLA